jgi:ribonuclease P protein component
VTSDPQSIRLQRRFLALAGRLLPARDADRADVPARIGLTTGKRNARRAVDRNLVRRIAREAARAAWPALDAAAGTGSLDIVLRLRATLPAPSGRPDRELRHTLHDEARGLLDELTQRLRKRTA